jgi:hypothetical protein
MDKYNDFVAALKELCTRHGVQLCVSGYDSLQVWPLKAGDEPIGAPDIEDMTKTGSNSPAT